MADDRIIVAIGRIERALTRVERIARTPSPAAPTDDYAQLAARHERLRAETESSIETLDRLIAAIDVPGIHG